MEENEEWSEEKGSSRSMSSVKNKTWGISRWKEWTIASVTRVQLIEHLEGQIGFSSVDITGVHGNYDFFGPVGIDMNG